MQHYFIRYRWQVRARGAAAAGNGHARAPSTSNFGPRLFLPTRIDRALPFCRAVAVAARARLLKIGGAPPRCTSARKITRLEPYTTIRHTGLEHVVRTGRRGSSDNACGANGAGLCGPTRKPGLRWRTQGGGGGVLGGFKLSEIHFRIFVHNF